MKLHFRSSHKPTEQYIRRPSGDVIKSFSHWTGISNDSEGPNDPFVVLSGTESTATNNHVKPLNAYEIAVVGEDDIYHDDVKKIDQIVENARKRQPYEPYRPEVPQKDIAPAIIEREMEGSAGSGIELEPALGGSLKPPPPPPPPTVIVPPAAAPAPISK